MRDIEETDEDTTEEVKNPKDDWDEHKKLFVNEGGELQFFVFSEDPDGDTVRIEKVGFQLNLYVNNNFVFSLNDGGFDVSGQRFTVSIGSLNSGITNLVKGTI